MTEIQNSKPVSVFGHWDLRYICYLVLEFWELSFCQHAIAPIRQLPFTDYVNLLKTTPNDKISLME